MKIISLQVENFKKLHAVEITPDGNFVQITGRNGQGKTSTLDAIWVALAGTGVAPKTPINKDATQAKIRLDLGEIVVTRIFKAGINGTFTSSITVESAEGARFLSPQKMLDSLLGALSFDPLAFSRMDDKQQFDELRKFVPGVDFAALERDTKTDYDARTDVNRRAKEARAAAAELKATPEPEKPVDEADLVEQMRTASEHNTSIETRRANREKMASKIADGKKALQQTNAQIKGWEEEIHVLKCKMEEAYEVIRVSDDAIKAMELRLADAPELPEPVDVAKIAARMNDARRANAVHVQWSADAKKRADLLASAKKLEDDSAALTKRMADRQADKLAKIAEAKLPIDGLGFGDGSVLLNDLPFDQASDAEKLRTSVAIAMAANAKLPVVLIRDGSLLDEDGLRMVAEMADARGAQVWIERVSSAGGVGIVLEDGYVKNEQVIPPSGMHTEDEPVEVERSADSDFKELTLPMSGDDDAEII